MFYTLGVLTYYIPYKAYIYNGTTPKNKVLIICIIKMLKIINDIFVHKDIIVMIFKMCPKFWKNELRSQYQRHPSLKKERW